MGIVEKDQQQKQRVGVADYFAILGVGEELVWNHAQQKIPEQQSENSSSNPGEDDAMLLERFYREIVDCRVVVSDDNASLLSYNTNQNQYVMGVPSPSPSDVASGVGTDVEKVELEGWTIIKQTRPAAFMPSHNLQSKPSLWYKGQVWDANLDPINGLSGEIQNLEAQMQREQQSRKSATPLKDLRRKVQSTFSQRQIFPYTTRAYKKKFFLSYRTRAPDESNEPAIADIALKYVKIHKVTIDISSDNKSAAGSAVTASTVSQKGAAALLRVAEAGKQVVQSRMLGTPTQLRMQNSMDLGDVRCVALKTLLKLPVGFDEWSIPEPYQFLNFPSQRPESKTKTILFNGDDPDATFGSASYVGGEMGVEAVEEDPIREDGSIWKDIIQPRLIHRYRMIEEDEDYVYVPILAVRRQKIGEEERFKEDTALVDIAVSFWTGEGEPLLPVEENEDDFEDDDEVPLQLRKTEWKATMVPVGSIVQSQEWQLPVLGTNCLMVKRNSPLGFCDATFKATVLDRFPYKNYKGLPLPEEELPMFCYPTGCRLFRSRFKDAPLPQYYGFVVKNERGDSIYISCVSFMEPLTKRKERQLERLSYNRKRVSLPHAKFWEKKQRSEQGRQFLARSTEWSENDDDMDIGDDLLTSFDEMTTFENKTICLVSRYPFWTAFRRFLSHLHNISSSSSDIPLERYISHLLLTVPIPKPGGPSILIPLPTFNIPMVLRSPSAKDLPLVDLPYERLMSCLDIPTIVTVVLGFLALEKKVIVMSTRPSLVLDVCELLRSLVFPFDLCAPYVPRLTEPFMSCLDFPGAIFVGIHDDGTSNGLAAVVRRSMPEDSTIVDLDSGSVDCSSDRMTVLNNSWGVIPPGPRVMLVSELETLCRDAGLVPGQEPLDSQIDSFFEASSPPALVVDEIPLGNGEKEPLDDRAIRDAFLRFFCSVLGGYERHLVVPDIDFLVSGNEWFDSQGFLASVSEEKSAFLGAMVSTQLFQSFIQRRTEASDVHCLLFDECLAEFHSSTSISPFGRLGDVETVQGNEHESPQVLYSLLVDQSATESYVPIGGERSFDTESRQGSDTDNGGYYLAKNYFGNSDDFAELAVNATGDWVTFPSRRNLPDGSRFVYGMNFPDRLNPSSYLPRQPESWLVEMSTLPTPMLTRSGKEIEEADRRRKLSTSYRGLQSQRRCLWQLPKLMGSHFLGTWLLCVPALVAQPNISTERQSKYLLHALGALRLLRGKQRIVPDEAAYRALIVACGRTKGDRRMELVKLFGLLRSDGIFPSAVTLGQYTRALAEGYSKRSMGVAEDAGTEVAEFGTGDSKRGSMDPELFLCQLDGNLTTLEDAGRRWRQKNNSVKDSLGAHEEPSTNEPKVGNQERQKKRGSRPWLPVATSSSFVPPDNNDADPPKNSKLAKESIRFLAIWSRTKSCDSCGYVPLDEEVQSGWDVFRENETPGAINCPRCGQIFIPMLAFKQFSIQEALTHSEGTSKTRSGTGQPSNRGSENEELPPQIGPLEHADAAYVTYISPASMRLSLERLIEEHGEDALERDKLEALDPELFCNFWWYCARFSLPLPLPVSMADSKHYCVFGAWDQRVAFRGCYSAARVLYPFSYERQSDKDMTIENIESFGDYPLLSRFNLQGYFSSVWDHEDLSEVLVTLVEACDKRDFRPVVECLLKCNKRRRDKFGQALAKTSISNVDFACSLPTEHAESDSLTSIQSAEFDVYRTILYLAKYQCTSAFHAFFPATLRPCKGYHFWCPIAPLPIFDRLYREAVKRVLAKGDNYTPLHDVSDIALAFRCVFGHLM